MLLLGSCIFTKIPALLDCGYIPATDIRRGYAHDGQGQDESDVATDRDGHDGRSGAAAGGSGANPILNAMTRGRITLTTMARRIGWKAVTKMMSARIADVTTTTRSCSSTSMGASLAKPSGPRPCFAANEAATPDPHSTGNASRG